jgi:PAT family beta-lactamase induction signal transducer AmpG
LLGSSSAAYQVGYQVALICSGALALVMASHAGWWQAYVMVAGLLLIGVLTTLRIREPERMSKDTPQIDPTLIRESAERLRPAPLLVGFLARPCCGCCCAARSRRRAIRPWRWTAPSARSA